LIIGWAPGWLLSRLSNLLVLPGLERNLRILMDWLLDIPFRNDIAVLVPDRTEHLHRRHFNAGDEVISEGDVGETAYIVDAGRLAVFKGENKVAELAEGDCFGEIALLSNIKRTATIPLGGLPRRAVANTLAGDPLRAWPLHAGCSTPRPARTSTRGRETSGARKTHRIGGTQ
jgi:hypothetical protein